MMCKDPYFLKHSIKFNQVHAFSFFSGHIIFSDNTSTYHDIYRVHGMIFHALPPLDKSDDSTRAKGFAQIYFYDTAQKQIGVRTGFSALSGLQAQQIIGKITRYINRCNKMVQSFKNAYLLYQSLDKKGPHYIICLEMRNSQTDTAAQAIVEYEDGSTEQKREIVDVRCYEAPMGTDGIIALTNGNVCNRRICVHEKNSDDMISVSTLSVAYDTLCYPFLFHQGRESWGVSVKKDRKITVKTFYSYFLFDRPGVFNPFIHSGSLSQQFWVDVGSRMETNNLN